MWGGEVGTCVITRFNPFVCLGGSHYPWWCTRAPWEIHSQPTEIIFAYFCAGKIFLWDYGLFLLLETPWNFMLSSSLGGKVQNIDFQILLQTVFV